MNGDAQNLSYFAQWFGLITTVLGAGLGGASVVAACVAARRALGAREQAELAKQAATRLGRIVQLGDLIGDMQELQIMLARADFLAIAGKANLLRGRIVRFKSEAYSELSEEENESLDLARDQLQAIVKRSVSRRGGNEFKAGQIQTAYGVAYEALNQVVAIHGQSVRGE